MFEKCPICEQEELAVAVFNLQVLSKHEIAAKVRCHICKFEGIQIFNISHKSFETQDDSLLMLKLKWRERVSMN